MYTSTATSVLENRIRWNDPMLDESPVELDDPNKTGTSGRHFQSFHNLVAVDDIYKAVPEVNMEMEAFNAFLSDIRKQAVLSVLSQVVDKHPAYVPATSYDQAIIENASAFDDAIGFEVAARVLELFASTSRRNLSEFNAKLSVENLKLEVDGYRHENGTVVSPGISHMLQQAVKGAQNRMFPKKLIIQSVSDAW